MGGRGSSAFSISRLPKLIGSEKQIKWAEDIRNEVVDIIRVETKAFLSNKKGILRSQYDKERYEEYMKYSKEALKVNKASKWIESFKSVSYDRNKFDVNKYKEGIAKKSKDLTQNAYENNLRDKMGTASIAYKKFVKQ